MQNVKPWFLAEGGQFGTAWLRTRVAVPRTHPLSGQVLRVSCPGEQPPLDTGDLRVTRGPEVWQRGEGVQRAHRHSTAGREKTSSKWPRGSPQKGGTREVTMVCPQCLMPWEGGGDRDGEGPPATAQQRGEAAFSRESPPGCTPRGRRMWRF